MTKIPQLYEAIKSIHVYLHVGEISILFGSQFIRHSVKKQQSVSTEENKFEEENDLRDKKLNPLAEDLEFNPDLKENYPPPYIIVDGRIIEVPPKLKEIRIKRCKKWTLPIMTFMPINNSHIPNSRL